MRFIAFSSSSVKSVCRSWSVIPIASNEENSLSNFFSSRSSSSSLSSLVTAATKQPSTSKDESVWYPPARTSPNLVGMTKGALGTGASLNLSFMIMSETAASRIRSITGPFVSGYR